MMEKLNLTDFKVWIYTLLPFIVFGGLLYFGYLPQAKSKAKLEKELKISNIEYLTSKDKADELAKLRSEVTGIEEKINVYRANLLLSEEVPEFLNRLTNLSSALGIQSVKTVPLPQEEGNFSYVLPLQMEFKGNFRSIAEYLYDIENLPGLFHVRSLTINAGRPPEVNLSMLAGFFVDRGRTPVPRAKLQDIELPETPELSGRNPFSTTGERLQKSTMQTRGSLALSCVCTSVDKKRGSAIINGRIISTGDTIDGFRVEEIRDEGVLLINDRGEKEFLGIR
jgi:Tfp pilus assembly protein PilO